MSMDENEKLASTQSGSESMDQPGRTGILVLSGFWVAGLGALMHFTAPSSTANPVYLPASVETQASEQTHASATQTPRNSVDFIVRFNEVEEVKTCLDMFREDPEGARIVFENWAADHPMLSGMTLKKTSYAGELILSWSTADGHRPNRADIISKQKELQTVPAVKYADPDYTAHAGGTTQ